MSNIYQTVTVKIKLTKLQNMLPMISHEREDEFLERHIPKYIHFYDYLIEKAFPFLEEINNEISWKVVYNGVSFYVSSERAQDGRFMSVVFQANNRLKFILYQGIQKINKDFSRETHPGRESEYYWYYVENLEFDRELGKVIVNSFNQKKAYLKGEIDQDSKLTLKKKTG